MAGRQMSAVERFEREVVFTVKRAMIEVSADTATFLEGIAGVEGKSVATVVEELAYARWQETRLIDIAHGLVAWGEAISNVGAP